MRISFVPLFTAAIVATAVLTACGRNPGARARAYPGTEKIEEALAAAEPKCVRFDTKQIGATAVVTGKEKFVTGRQGSFILESLQISQASDRTDRTVPSSIFQMTDFEDASGRAPRLAIEARCLDLKGEGLALAISPVTQIESANGRVLQSQPVALEVAANGRMRAETKFPEIARKPIPANEIPEAALLLGVAHAKNFKVISFHVTEAEDGSLTVRAEFIGVDPKLSRLYIRVEAVYGWDAAE